jgi:hypothetical protein
MLSCFSPAQKKRESPIDFILERNRKCTSKHISAPIKPLFNAFKERSLPKNNMEDLIKETA